MTTKPISYHVTATFMEELILTAKPMAKTAESAIAKSKLIGIDQDAYKGLKGRDWNDRRIVWEVK